MKAMKKLFSSLVALFIVCTMMITGVSAATVSQFVQNTETPNTYGYVDPETEQFETYSTVAGTAGNYTSISSKIYKPVSGDTLIVCFHGNGEGGLDGTCNNYSQLAGNQMAVKFISPEVQEAYKGAYVLAFQAPDYWYNDYTVQAKAIIDRAKEEFGIKQVFVTGLSAGGLMTERMLSKYGDYFSGALISCAAIAKNGQYVEGLGGDYSLDYSLDENGNPVDENAYFNVALNLQAPADLESYATNYAEWLVNMAESNVPMYLVHCTKDNTIAYEWSEIAYKTIKDYREQAGLDGDIYFQTIDSTGINKDTGSEMSGHWAWVKMYNNEISVGGVSTMSWFESLSTSTNTYEAKSYELPTAGASDQENTFKYNLIAEVREDGEKVVAIEIDMNGQKVDAAQLTTDMFKVTGYNEDASGLAHTQTTMYGLFGSKDEPNEIEVANVSVNERGNIVLELATLKGVLNYAVPSLRNLETNMRYNIAAVELPLIQSVSPTKEDKKTTSVETGDNTAIVLFVSITLLSAGAFLGIKKFC